MTRLPQSPAERAPRSICTPGREPHRTLVALLAAALSGLPAVAAFAAGIAFLPQAIRDEIVDGPPTLDLLTWQLPDGLLVADRLGPAGQVRHGRALPSRHADAEWFLVAKGGPGTAVPSAADGLELHGEVHPAGRTAWVVEVPRANLEAFYTVPCERIQIRLNAPPLRPAASPPAASGLRMSEPLPVDPAVKTAYIDGIELGAYRLVVREICGDRAILHDGLTYYVATRYYNTTFKNIAGGYLAQTLANLGYAVELDTFLVDGFPCRNIVATRTGVVTPHEIVVVGGHYDSISSQPATNARGAEDNASGAGLVMELARASADRSFERTVQFVLFDAEELGLHGSYHFVEEAAADGRLIVANLTADMVAYHAGNFGVRVVGMPIWDEFADVLLDNVAAYTSLASLRSHALLGSDHLPFSQAGIPALLAIDWDFALYPYYHTTLDTWVRIAGTSAQGHQIARAVAATLADVAGLLPGSTDAPELPATAVNLAARPNPFNPRTTLVLDLGVAAAGELTIFDLRGRRVATPLMIDHAAGRHTVTWDGTDAAGRSLPSGAYVCRLRTTAGSAAVKLVLAR